MKTKLHCLLLLLLWSAGTLQVIAQGTTAFTYQGQLRDGGTNANGVYGFTFKLYDSLASSNQVGGTITSTAALVNGLFTVNLDFGPVFNGAARWLDITVTNNGVSQTLSPRVSVSPVPYAQFSAVAATVTNGSITSVQLANGAVTPAKISGAVTNANNLTNGNWSVGVGSYQPSGGPLITNALMFAQQGTVQALLATSLGGLGVAGDIYCNTGHLDAIRFNGSGSAGITGDNNVGLIIKGNSIALNSSGGVFGAIPKMQVFSSSGTFQVPTNVNWIMVELWGGGGGGGGGSGGGTFTNGNTHYGAAGGGGGGGGYGKDIIQVTPGSSLTVTVGAGGAGGYGGASFSGQIIQSGGAGGGGGNGGDSSIGTLTATGGGGGNGASSGYSFGDGASGNPGPGGYSDAQVSMFGGVGGISFFNGLPVVGGVAPNGGVASYGDGFGPGGGGAAGQTSGTSGLAGYAGAPGRVIVYY